MSTWVSRTSLVSHLVALAVTMVLVASRPALAESCDVDGLPRESAAQNRLAVRVAGVWQFFTPSDDDAPGHTLELGRDPGSIRTLCMAWEAPPYKARKRQIVYASTKYTEKQPFLLYRNSAAAGIPVLRRLFGTWERTPGDSDLDEEPSRVFREYHRKRPSDPYDPPWKDLRDWHDTSAWFANNDSYEVVLSASRALLELPYGTERLLVLQGGRDLTSWVSIETHPPFSGERELHVAVSYSGDLEGPGLRVYRYLLKAK